MYHSMNGMGADACPPGFYRDSLFKVCLPKGGTALQTGKSLLAQGVAQTPEVRQAGIEAAQDTAARKALRYVKENPLHVGIGVAALAAILFMIGRGSK